MRVRVRVSSKGYLEGLLEDVRVRVRGRGRVGVGLGVDPKHACGRAQAESIACSKVSVLQLPSPPA